MADEPLKELGGRTPLEAADTPNLDIYAAAGEIGMVDTIPKGMSPGSDTANLSVMGYDPEIYYSGRSPLEALSIGVPMKETDVALRCNIVTISETEGLSYAEQTILDHSSGEISTEDAAVLLKSAAEKLANETYQFYVGTSYRHCLIWDHGSVVPLTPPHDVLTQTIGQYLPLDENLRRMQEISYEILKNHPLNLARKEAGLNPANSLWFWGAGTRPALSSFYEKYHRRAAMISAVDLLKGIAVGAGIDNIIVEGANGGLNTNYEGKAQAAIKAVLRDGYDMAYIHLEAPDEMGHQGSFERKIRAIENMDKRILGPIREAMVASGEDYRILVLPDHPTPVRLRTHVAEPVPYLLYDSTKKQNHTWKYNEKEAEKSGNFIAKGCDMMGYFLNA